MDGGTKQSVMMQFGDRDTSVRPTFLCRWPRLGFFSSLRLPAARNRLLVGFKFNHGRWEILFSINRLSKKRPIVDWGSDPSLLGRSEDRSEDRTMKGAKLMKTDKV